MGAQGTLSISHAVSVLDEEAAAFTAALERDDASRNELDHARLKLEKAPFESEKRKRAMDREERKQAREEASRVELQKFRLLLEFVRDGRVANPSECSSETSKEH
ncbi:hypothetical protein BWQ96_09386 [Gracilariopsis chorda]|uniref:Uncharacterized protein n=1 Tax=Gracilariopsis chorda TaxID=448386 RepID=A0A2V3IFT0_9FLOR|nr:hypothetical protein BWQ96_09386 [Gracilariopsis chorda]|eukprot:PXF40893.1 hypothetical protein BWQ96_09386 [Gracilariopsis chorda]